MLHKDNETAKEKIKYI